MTLFICIKCFQSLTKLFEFQNDDRYHLLYQSGVRLKGRSRLQYFCEIVWVSTCLADPTFRLSKALRAVAGQERFEHICLHFWREVEFFFLEFKHPSRN